MRVFISYFTVYLRTVSRPALLVTVIFIAALIAANYKFGLEHRVQALPWYAALGVFFGFFLVLLALVWGLQYEWVRTPVFQPKLVIILAFAALFFAAKMVHWDLTGLLPRSVAFPWTRYVLLVTQLPLKLLLLFGFLFALRRCGLLEGDSFASSVGLTGRDFNAAPYFGLLLLLLPLIALASMQHDFLLVYPKVQNLAFLDPYTRPAWPWKLLYELSYGLDFLGIELFFRGLLVIALLRFAGTDAILPMAAFYCTIHFGKPLGECITSFFGGLILGVLAARTRTIFGGLIVHLGLAWLMELGGWLGHLLRH
jgi:Type II CAAX prenyl endopeptidase Rce1-like